jgi:hypothetical protein
MRFLKTNILRKKTLRTLEERVERQLRYHPSIEGWRKRGRRGNGGKIV